MKRTPLKLHLSFKNLYSTLLQRIFMVDQKLFTPFIFPSSGKEMNNRIALAPMTNLQSNDDGTLADDEYRWLVRRAKEGFGMIITCAANVSQDGKGWPGELGIFDDSHIEGLTRLANGIKQHKSLALVQIFHGGARSPENVIGQQPWSASAHTMEISKTPVEVRAASHQEIERVIEDFVAAAQRAEKAGFDGVELHGAHGYLLHQFLSTATNQRTDEWGGSFENRIKLLRTILQKTKTVVSKSFLVGVRLSPEDKYTFKGIDFDESIALSKILAEDGADFIHLSPWDALKKPEKYPDGNKTLIAYFREAIPNTPIIVAGNIWNRTDAEKAIELGADIVAIGKAAIAHADWPTLVEDENCEPLRPPFTEEKLREADLGETFISYMKRWEGFVQQ
jgi:2,4-dienoyl-CoA reductase-like NADH-dependent reductase (Old Yellow Enzyme family)